jgi:hypothetical protein
MNKAKYPHKCPHSRPCPVGSLSYGPHANGPPVAHPMKCYDCPSRSEHDELVRRLGHNPTVEEIEAILSRRCSICLRFDCGGLDKLKDCPYARATSESQKNWLARIPVGSRLGRELVRIGAAKRDGNMLAPTEVWKLKSKIERLSRRSEAEAG